MGTELAMVLVMFAISWASLWYINKREYVMASMIFVGGMGALLLA